MAKTSTKQKRKAVAKVYEPTEAEQATLEAFLAREKEKPPGPKLKVSKKGGATHIASDHPDVKVGITLLMESLGTTDPCFYDGFIEQLVYAGCQGKEVDERDLNFMLAMVRGIRPKDQLRTPEQ